MNLYTYCFLSKILAIGGSLFCYYMTDSLWSFLFLLFASSVVGEDESNEKKHLKRSVDSLPSFA